MKNHSDDNILPNCRLPYQMNESGNQVEEKDGKLRSKK